MKDDLISRQAAKNALLKCGEIMLNPDKAIAAEVLDRVPSAGPDAIIYCKDCQFYDPEYYPNCGACLKDMDDDGGGFICSKNDDDFCSDAEVIPNAQNNNSR